jgi:hypothetical protein
MTIEVACLPTGREERAAKRDSRLEIKNLFASNLKRSPETTLDSGWSDPQVKRSSSEAISEEDWFSDHCGVSEERRGGYPV